MTGARGALLVALVAAGGVATLGSLALAGGDGADQRATALTKADLTGIPAPDRALTLASERWQRLTRRPVSSLRSLGGAHPGAKSIRVSRTRKQLTRSDGRQRFPYPRRTVIVKTATVGDTVTLVAIMRKVAAGDAVDSWRYVEYTRGSSGGSFSKVGGGQSLCSSCHVGATETQGSDAVFFRLK